MIEKIGGLPAGIDGVRSRGKLNRDDYDAVVVPLVEGAVRDHRRLRWSRYPISRASPPAAWEDVTLGLRALGSFDGCAIASDLGWVRELFRLTSFLIPCPIRVFAQADREEAVAWLLTLPEGPAISHRVIADAGVVVVEVEASLRAEDIDALAAVVDGWQGGRGA